MNEILFLFQSQINFIDFTSKFQPRSTRGGYPVTHALGRYSSRSLNMPDVCIMCTILQASIIRNYSSWNILRGSSYKLIYKRLSPTPFFFLLPHEKFRIQLWISFKWFESNRSGCWFQSTLKVFFIQFWSTLKSEINFQLLDSLATMRLDWKGSDEMRTYPVPKDFVEYLNNVAAEAFHIEYSLSYSFWI